MVKKFEERFLTPVFTVYFPEIEQPSKLSKKYRVVACFDPDEDLSSIKHAMKTAAVNKWGSKIPKDLYLPLKTREQEKSPEYWPEGLHAALITTFDLSASECLVDRTGKKQLTADKFYPGCKARAIIHCYAYDGVGDNPAGITLSLDLLQYVEDGERIGGGIGAARSLLDENPLPKQEPATPDLGTAEDSSDDPFAF